MLRSVDYGKFAATFVPGSDGNLVQEFVAMERIMYAQYSAISPDANAGAVGTHQAYVCAARTNPVFNCLDIAAPSTGENQFGNGFNTSYKTFTGSLSGNIFVHNDAMLEVSSDGMWNVTTNQLFGSSTVCDWGENSGDGVISALDAWVVLAAQFRTGSYAAIGTTPFSQVTTVSVRTGTGDRCTDEQPAPSRLVWNRNVIDNHCYTGADQGGGEANGANTAASAIPLLDPTGWSLLPLPSMWQLVEQDSPFSHNSLRLGSGVGQLNMSSVAVESIVPVPLRRRALGYGSYGGAEAEDMAASIFEMRETDGEDELGKMNGGRWYWINIPRTHAVIDITLLGVDNREGVQLSNEPFPDIDQPAAPTNPSEYQLRFGRHRELYGLSVTKCASLRSPRGTYGAMQNGVVSVSQDIGPGAAACGFDLALWKPHGTASFTSTCRVAVASGSVSMDGARGSVQKDTACPVLYGSSSPPSSSPPSIPPPSPLSPPLPSPPPSPPSSPKSSESPSLLMIVMIFVALSVLIVLAGVSLFIHMKKGNTTKVSPSKKAEVGVRIPLIGIPA
jgi:hypothetical protein